MQQHTQTHTHALSLSHSFASSSSFSLLLMIMLLLLLPLVLLLFHWKESFIDLNFFLLNLVEKRKCIHRQKSRVRMYEKRNISRYKIDSGHQTNDEKKKIYFLLLLLPSDSSTSTLLFLLILLVSLFGRYSIRPQRISFAFQASNNRYRNGGKKSYFVESQNCEIKSIRLVWWW